jgi:hypothetical protein
MAANAKKVTDGSWWQPMLVVVCIADMGQCVCRYLAEDGQCLDEGICYHGIHWPPSTTIDVAKDSKVTTVDLPIKLVINAKVPIDLASTSGASGYLISQV